MIGSAATEFDSVSVWVVVATCLFAFVMFMAINGFLAILWLLALGPLSLAMFGMFAQMGGVGCQRLVATLYVISLGVFIVWVASAS